MKKGVFLIFEMKRFFHEILSKKGGCCIFIKMQTVPLLFNLARL